MLTCPECERSFFSSHALFWHLQFFHGYSCGAAWDQIDQLLYDSKEYFKYETSEV